MCPSNTQSKCRIKIDVEFLLKQPVAHTNLFLSYSGAGKTTLSRFVAWMNGLSVFQIKMHNKYTGLDFDDDLRAVLRRSGCRVGDRNNCNHCGWAFNIFIAIF